LRERYGALHFGLVVRFDVNGHNGFCQGRHQRGLDPVADFVRSGDAHVAGHDKMEIDEGRPARSARAKTMNLNGVSCVIGENAARRGELVFRGRFIEQAAGIGSRAFAVQTARRGNARLRRKAPVRSPVAHHLNNAAILDIGRNNLSGWSRKGRKLSRS
jgi:hypothetical protein